MKNLFLCIMLISISTFNLAQVDVEYFGEYTGTVQTEWLEEGRKMKLLSDFSFTDPNGLVWTANKDSVIDGASIPRLAWILIGSPFSGRYRDASVMHDIACDERSRTWESVHLAFYYGMRASGVTPKKAKMMYAAVYHNGPRWPIIRNVSVNAQVTTAELATEKQSGFSLFAALGKLMGIKKTATLSEPPPPIETVTIQPKERTLDQDGLDALIQEIDAAETDINALSLEDIQNFSL